MENCTSLPSSTFDSQSSILNPPSALSHRLRALADMRGLWSLHLNVQLGRRSKRSVRESMFAKFRHRQNSGFIQTGSGNADGMFDAFRVGERDDAGAVWHVRYCSNCFACCSLRPWQIRRAYFNLKYGVRRHIGRGDGADRRRSCQRPLCRGLTHDKTRANLVLSLPFRDRDYCTLVLIAVPPKTSSSEVW